ncbi:putative bifunctional diguanylate cyclase/phosphodiesterase [Glacieibacterium sp.]|uniref:putative bifunctional diguanylate cyclase/phosphodiesterase n=1 Tax=Glacieibacterium sp. TaxID=2860237 RepID=UPI003AFFE8B3
MPDDSVDRPEPLFVLAPRYARDVGASLRAGDMAVEIVTRAAEATPAFERCQARVAVIDARGALASGLVVAHELGLAVEARHGALLVLLARGDAGAVGAAYAAGATHVLTSPFTAADLIEAVRFAQRMTMRIGDAAAGRAATVEKGIMQRDALTGLASGQQAHDWVALLLDQDVVAHPSVIVMLIAVGRFGQINAAYGRTVADALLQAAADRLNALIGPAKPGKDGAIGDDWLVARMAGAEFAIVLPSPTTFPEAQAIAQKVIAIFNEPFAIDSRLIHLAVRIGIACANADYSKPSGSDLLFRHASAALAVARTGAPGDIEVFRPSPDGDPLTRLAELESDLRRAIEIGEFEIVYQPQVMIDSGVICGVEALVRWAHPVLGQLSATTLLEVAASAEVAIQLGKHIRLRALLEAAAWPEALCGLQLSVNVSAGDLRAADFDERLDWALAQSGFPADRLTVEITESDLIENLTSAATGLRTLQSRGVRIALDDFGTGYSSLAYLKALPLDYLKLDKSLTSDLAGSARDRVIVRGVVDMARALGIRVTAEGVETRDDLDLVAEAQCDWYQGYYCSTPMPGAALVAFVQDWNAARSASQRPQAVQ